MATIVVEAVGVGCVADGVTTTEESSPDEALVDEAALGIEVVCPIADAGIALLLVIKLLVAVDKVEQSTVSVIVISVTVIAV